MELPAILSTPGGNLYGRPVWTLARQQKGYIQSEGFLEKRKFKCTE